MSSDPPGRAFDRYLAEVDRTHPERPRYQPGPFRWWHPVPAVVMLGGVVALAAWKVGRAWGGWRVEGRDAHHESAPPIC